MLRMLLFLALTFGCTFSVQAKDRELMVLVLIDALRPDHMGSYGYPEPTTPELDKLAVQSTRYTRAYANAPWTRPSTASFLTGLNASRHQTQTNKEKLPEDVTTLAQRLKKAGWTTAGFVANGNGGSLAKLQKGFDVFRDPTNAYTKKKRGKTYNGLPTGHFLVNRALKWLDKSKADKIFMFLFLVDPHDPYGAPQRLEKQFLKGYTGKITRTPLWEYKNNYPPERRKAIVAVYDAGIRYGDEAMGSLFNGLKERKLYDQATLMISADHGEGMGEHGFYMHAHQFWDEVVKVPLLVKGPGFKQGHVDHRLTQSIDVTKTLAQLGAADTSGMPGYGLLEEPAPHIISEYNEFGIHRQAIVGPRYKVIWQRPADEAWYMRAAKKKEYFPSVSFGKEVVRVFDLKADPGETKDLASQMPPEAAELLKTLREFVAQSDS